MTVLGSSDSVECSHQSDYRLAHTPLDCRVDNFMYTAQYTQVISDDTRVFSHVYSVVEDAVSVYSCTRRCLLVQQVLLVRPPFIYIGDAY